MYADRWVNRFAITTAFMTLCLLLAGALVTSTGSGLAVPDWPKSYGQWMPPMVGGVFYEHGHRMVAGFVGFLTLILTSLIVVRENRRWVKILAGLALVAVVCQALLGGLTVLLRLPPPVSISHAMLAQTFFCLTVVIVAVTSPAWQRPVQPLGETSFLGMRLETHCLFTTVVFVFQLFFGATMRHFGAGLAIPDFPTAFGGFLPPEFTFPVAIHFAHRLGALTATFFSATLVYRLMRDHSHRLGLVSLGGGLITLVFIQVMLGAFVIWAKKPVSITTLHLATGASCLATSVLLTLVVYRMRRAS